MLPVRTDLLRLRGGGDQDPRRRSGRLAGRAPPAAVPPAGARGLRSGARHSVSRGPSKTWKSVSSSRSVSASASCSSGRPSSRRPSRRRRRPPRPSPARTRRRPRPGRRRRRCFRARRQCAGGWRHGAPVTNRPERLVEIQTPDVNYVFSSLGGTLVHAKLREQAVPDGEGDPNSGQDLVRTTDAAGRALPDHFPELGVPHAARRRLGGEPAGRRTPSCSRPTRRRPHREALPRRHGALPAAAGRRGRQPRRRRRWSSTDVRRSRPAGSREEGRRLLVGRSRPTSPRRSATSTTRSSARRSRSSRRSTVEKAAGRRLDR